MFSQHDHCPHFCQSQTIYYQGGRAILMSMYWPIYAHSFSNYPPNAIKHFWQDIPWQDVSQFKEVVLCTFFRFILLFGCHSRIGSYTLNFKKHIIFIIWCIVSASLFHTWTHLFSYGVHGRGLWASSHCRAFTCTKMLHNMVKEREEHKKLYNTTLPYKMTSAQASSTVS